MKIRISYIISVIILLQIITGTATAQNLPDGEVDITINQIVQKKELLYINFNLDMSNIKIKSRQSLAYTPTLNLSTKTVSFPEIVLRGRSSYKSYVREVALMNKANRINADLPSSYYAAIKAFGNNNKDINYEYVIPYENWMASSKLVIKGEMYACGDTINLEPETYGLPIRHTRRRLRESSFRRHVSKFDGSISALEAQSEGKVFKLYFPASVSKIEKRYGSNTAVLKSLKRFIDDIGKSSDLEITKIQVIGFTSIGGNYADNEILSYARAKSMYYYFLEKLKISDLLIDAYFAGGNWSDLKIIVANSDMVDKKEIVNIIRNVQTSRERVDMLRNINGGEAYRYLSKNYFSQLQYVYIRIYVDSRF